MNSNTPQPSSFPHDPPPANPVQARSPRPLLLQALLIAIVIAIAGAIPAARSWLSREHIIELTRAMGLWAPLGLIVIGAVGPIFFVPRAAICLVAGLLYGVTLGSLLGMVSGSAGAIVHYYLSMGLLARTAERLTPARWQRSLTALRSHPFRALLLLRLFPLSNASLVNMISGLLRLPFRPYILATILGTLPITVIYAFWGKTAGQPNREHVLFSVVLLLLLTLVSYVVPRLHAFRR